MGVRAEALSAQLRDAGDRVVAVLEPIDEATWQHVPEPGTWSIGKEAEHVADAVTYHLWIVRLSVGEKVSSQRPVLERKQMKPTLSRDETVDVIRLRVDHAASYLSELTDAQLALPTKPPRAGALSVLAGTIEAVLIGHLDGHRGSILEKLSASVGNRA